MKKVVTTILTLLGAVTGLALCTTLLSAAEPAENWKAQCAKCHADDGSGATKMGKMFKVLDYTDPEVQKELKDEEMLKAITDGIKKDGKTRMKAYKEIFSEEEIQALVAYVRTLSKEE